MTDYTKIPEHKLAGELGTDASKWADALVQYSIKHSFNIDDEILLTWFANAIETAKLEPKSIIVTRNHAKAFIEAINPYEVNCGHREKERPSEARTFLKGLMGVVPVEIWHQKKGNESCELLADVLRQIAAHIEVSGEEFQAQQKLQIKLN